MAHTGMASAIIKYFGKTGSLYEFQKELKALSEEEKLELAQGSAKELGYTQEQVNFPLK
jgi:hypothetical protein